MKLEDPTETFEIMEKRAGEADTSVTSGSEMKENGLGGYADQRSTRIDKKKRINLRDLVNQKPGEAHIMFGDELCRARVFYADPTQVMEASINKFVMVDYAKKGVIDKISGSFEKLDKLFNTPTKNDQEDESEVISDEGIKSLFNDFIWAKKRQDSSSDAAIFAASLMEIRDKYKDVEIQDKAGLIDHEPEPKIDTMKNEESEPKVEEITSVDLSKDEDELPPGLDVSDVSEAKTESTSENLDDGDETILGILEDGESPDVSVKNQAQSIADDFEKMLHESVIANLEKKNDGKPISAKERNDSKPSSELENLEKMSGKDDASAKESASRSLEMLSKKSTYPGQPTPQKEEKEKLANRLAMLIEKVETSGDDSFV
jgi:intracellular multiplication protein IcmO